MIFLMNKLILPSSNYFQYCPKKDSSCHPISSGWSTYSCVCFSNTVRVASVISKRSYSICNNRLHVEILRWYNFGSYNFFYFTCTYFIIVSQYHECRICTSLNEPELTVIIEWTFGLEGTLKLIYLSPMPEAGEPSTRPGYSEPHPG